MDYLVTTRHSVRTHRSEVLTVGFDPNFSGIRLATDLDRMELLVSHETFIRCAPLVERLRRRIIDRRRYELLRAIMVENAMVTGQVDETEAALALLARHWRWCPARYIGLPRLWLRYLSLPRRARP
jgi:hypothetical protein